MENPEASNSSKQNDLIERLKRRMQQMDARAKEATRALGLPLEDWHTVLQALSSSGLRRISDEGDPSSFEGKMAKDLVISELRVDEAAKALTAGLGLPEETRYEVMRTLWAEAEDSLADETMSDMVERMERDCEKVREKLALPSEKRENVMKVLYGDAGMHLRAEYRRLHPLEDQK